RFLEDAHREKAAMEKRQINQLSQKLKEMRKHLQDKRTELTLDTLTQVYSARALDEHLERIASLNRLLDTPCTLVVIDIDKFSKVSSQYGRKNGDLILKSVAKEI